MPCRIQSQMVLPPLELHGPSWFFKWEDAQFFACFFCESIRMKCEQGIGGRAFWSTPAIIRAGQFKRRWQRNPNWALGRWIRGRNGSVSLDRKRQDHGRLPADTKIRQVRTMLGVLTTSNWREIFKNIKVQCRATSTRTDPRADRCHKTNTK